MIDEGEILQQNHMMMKPKGSFDILTAWVSHTLVFLWHRCKEFKRYLCEIKRDTDQKRQKRSKIVKNEDVNEVMCGTHCVLHYKGYVASKELVPGHAFSMQSQVHNPFPGG